jgi:hypothetical protein
MRSMLNPNAAKNPEPAKQWYNRRA